MELTIFYTFMLSNSSYYVASSYFLLIQNTTCRNSQWLVIICVYIIYTEIILNVTKKSLENVLYDQRTFVSSYVLYEKY